MTTWDVFISHASEDKSAVVIPLAEALKRAGLRVWLDRQELRLGDSLREKIDEGLANSHFGIVILSPNFLSKGWPRRELDGLFAIEDAAERKVILPVWHNINKAILAKYSPILADRLAANIADGIPAVANSIIQVVTELGSGSPVNVAPTPSRLLTNFLERRPNRADIIGFLTMHPNIIRKALGLGADSEFWSRELGPVKVDFCASKKQYTTGEETWYFLQFEPPHEALFLHSALSPAVIERVSELRNLRRWISRNLGEARKILPSVRSGFSGIVLAGRRQLSETEKEYLRQYNEELSGIKVRTYDWLIDAAVEM